MLSNLRNLGMAVEDGPWFSGVPHYCDQCLIPHGTGGCRRHETHKLPREPKVRMATTLGEVANWRRPASVVGGAPQTDAMPTMGAFSGRPPMEPRNGASP